MPESLRAGDILISRGAPAGHAGIALFQPDGVQQQLLPEIRNMEGGFVRPRANFIAHAVTPTGVVAAEGWHQVSAVYRPARIPFVTLERMTEVALEIGRGARYGLARAVLKSWTASTRFSSNARERLAKYRDRLQNHQGQVAIVKNLYCSEYVVLVYQLGVIDEANDYFINLNAKHTLPPDLRRWLDNRPAHWTRVGTTAADDTLNYNPA